ncbi:hypothetical protein Scep_025707 [Stephania cephalantha]|uniref:Uncharacterized protein n=1 Tax=Stephania cephalantha TaxID=152367 RepID=A0AAP0ER13_9MAGN
MFVCIHLYSDICCEDVALAYIDERRTEGVFFAWRSRRSPARRGGAQPYRVRWGYGLGGEYDLEAGMALGLP